MQPVDTATLLEAPPDATEEADIPKLVEYLQELIQQLNDLLISHGLSINNLIAGVITTAQIQPQVSPPLSPQTGWVAYADGVQWNPGAGEGLYVYKSDNAWHKIA